MKLLTKEEEAEHYRATLLGGTLAGAAGIAVGVGGVALASRRYHFIRNLTLPLKAFLCTSSGTFAGIIGADHASRSYEAQRNPIDVEYRERESERAEAEKAGKTFSQRAMDFGKKERYKIVGASWIASMATAFAIVNRNQYLSGPQKIVQARVYAQFLTLGVLVASAAFEISDSKNQEGHWETVKYVDPKDPDHKRMLERKEFKAGESAQESGGDDMWKEMVAAEEQRLKDQEAEEAKFRKPKHDRSKGGANGGPKSRATETERRDPGNADPRATSTSKPGEKTNTQSGDASMQGNKAPESGTTGKQHEDQKDESGKKTPRTGDGKDGEANTGGTGQYEGKDVKPDKTKPVKGADEAKDKDGESTKGKK